MNQHNFNERLRQVTIFIMLIMFAVLLIWEMAIFIPGLLGGLTLYVLSRSLYFRLIFKNKWKKNRTAFLFILAYLIIVSLPVYLSITLISPKINSIAENQEKIINGIQVIGDKIKERTGMSVLTSDNAKAISAKVTSFVPKVLNSTAMIFTNIIMMFFLFYYLLISGREVEKYLGKIIPLKPENINILAGETKMMVKANALGIPIICIIQGAFAALGYWIFGVTDWGLWGFLTGVFAFFPLVGTMIIWIPLVGYIFATGDTWNGTALTIYSIIVTGNVDYIARLSLMKKMGNVHPMITVLGVIVGLNLFGFMGLIFGPLLISYFIVMLKIYVNEFGDNNDDPDTGDAPQGTTG